MLKTSTIDRVCDKFLQTEKKPFLVFDRDGTLVPITDDPALAVMDPHVRELLNKLVTDAGLHVGLLSARSIYQLKKDLPDGNHILAGNYGLEIETGDGKLRFCHTTAQEARVYFERAMSSFAQALPERFQAIFEDHGLSLCLHWHRTPEYLLEELHLRVSKIAEEFPQLNFKTLNTSYEIWPAVDWDKAHGMAKILELLQINPDDVVLLFAGDSLMDEPAFNWVNQHGGISILVGRRDKSSAELELDTPRELHQLISRILQKAMSRTR